MSQVIRALKDTALFKQPNKTDTQKLVPKGQGYSIDEVLIHRPDFCLVKLSYQMGDWYIRTSDWTLRISSFSKEQFKQCFPNAKQEDIDIFYEPMLEACMAYKIDTPIRLSAFFAQIGHECADFKYKEEIASGAAYEGRKDLGNTKPDDGKRYKG